MKIILVLGSPNGTDGSLSEMAKSRLDVCIALYKSGHYKIVLTGGFGLHFNTTNKPHAYYLKQFLTSNGIPEADILCLVESRHSVEDATLSQKIIRDYDPEEMIIVTSDYHVARAQLIFDAVYAPYTKFRILSAPSNLVEPELLKFLSDHEKSALQDLLDNGVRF